MANQTKQLLCIAALVLGFSLQPAAARTINWGNSVSDNLFDSTGAVLDDTFSFQLGSFGSSFLPTPDNYSSWEANWLVFDEITAPASNGWNSGLSYFTSTATMEANGTSSANLYGDPVFGFGDQAYIWVYDTKAPTFGVSEWALITNPSWTFPSGSDQTGLPLDWRLEDVTEIIFGGANNVQGPGQYTNPPGSFDLQTHAVPEPGGVFLLGLALVLRLGRSRRRN